MTTPENRQRAGDRRAFFGCLAALAGLAVLGLAVAAVIFNFKAGGETVLAMPLSQTPSQRSFSLAGTRRVEVWTDLEVTHAGISYRVPNDELPHVLDYGVEVKRGSETVVQLRCNPFDSNFAKTSYYGSSGGIDNRSYDGRIRSCSFSAPAGQYTVVAALRPVGEDPRIVFKKTVLILRASE